MSKFTPEELRELERISFRNCVLYNKSALLAINNGARAADLFNLFKRRSLRKKGVTKTIQLGGEAGKGRKVVLTQRTLKILGLED